MMAGRLRTACASGLLLLVLALPAAVQAQFTYSFTNGRAIITGYTGPGGVVIIPGTFNGVMPVIGIGNYAFSNRTSLTSVKISNSVTSIGLGAFDFL